MENEEKNTPTPVEEIVDDGDYPFFSEINDRFYYQERIPLMVFESDDVADKVLASYPKKTYTGFFHANGEIGYIQNNNFDSSNQDIYVTKRVVQALCLRNGDLVTVKRHEGSPKEISEPTDIVRINYLYRDDMPWERKNFYEMGYQAPTKSFSLFPASAAMKALSLTLPIPMGGFVCVKGTRQSGKQFFLTDLASAIKAGGNENTRVIYCKLNTRPDEKRRFQSLIRQDIAVLLSPMNERRKLSIDRFQNVLSHLKRLAELGQNVVLILEDLSRLFYDIRQLVVWEESKSKNYSSDLRISMIALQNLKEILSTARSLSQGGSITVISHFGDEPMIAELAACAHTEIHLLPYPQKDKYQLDIMNSYGEYTNALSSAEYQEAAYKLKQKLQKPTSRQKIKEALSSCETVDDLIKALK